MISLGLLNTLFILHILYIQMLKFLVYLKYCRKFSQSLSVIYIICVILGSGNTLVKLPGKNKEACQEELLVVVCTEYLL